MKKNKLFIILVILIAALVFATAQICNQCGTTSTQDTKTDIEDDTDTDNTSSGTTAGETSAGTTATTITGEPQAPEIVELDVFMGPEYHEESGFCFYRVRVEATGNPVPDIVFSKDDSDNAWGDNICQINIEDPSDTYTLTVTATNSEGEDEATLDFAWGCNGAESEPEPVVAEEEITIDADTTKCGFISDATGAPFPYVYMEPIIAVGDNNINNVEKAYMTFSLSHFDDLGDITITDAEIRIPEVDSQNEPWNAGSELHILVKDYGETLDYPEDFERGGEIIKVFETSDTLDNLSFSTEELKNELQSAISAGKELFQLKFSLNNKSDNSLLDRYLINTNSAEMYIEYLPSE
jgi:hypothetical protein